MTSLLCVDPAMVSRVWPTVRAKILSALIKGGGDFAELERDVLSGDALLWVVVAGKSDIRAAVVTQLESTEQGKVCLIQACAGDGLEEWLRHIEKIEEFARAEQCFAVRFQGRPGWKRVMPEYQTLYVTMQKEL